MLAGYLKELGSFFDRRFIVAYWAPTFIFVTLAMLGAAAAHWGVAPALQAWTTAEPLLQAILVLAVLLTITILAYVLRAFTTPLIRFYEGYWPLWLDKRLGERGRQHHLQRRQRVRKQRYRDYYFAYPNDRQRVRPTRLGNALTAAEEYPMQLYGLDAVVWWPRLVPQLQDEHKQSIDAALTPLLALLNLSGLFALLALVGGVALVVDHVAGHTQPLWLFLLVFFGGWLLAWLCYGAAVTQAGAYGEQIRVAFDLYRHNILEALHIPRPDNLRAERRLWDKLNHWLYFYTPPFEPGGDDPFYYDTYKPPAPSPAPTQPQQVELTLKGSPRLILRQEKAEDEQDD